MHWKKRQKEIQRLQAKHGKDRSLIRQFPDLKVEQRTAPCSNGMRGSTARRVPPPGMKQFPVGHRHKQGLELITPGTDLQWMGGKKPREPAVFSTGAIEVVPRCLLFVCFRGVALGFGLAFHEMRFWVYMLHSRPYGWFRSHCPLIHPPAANRFSISSISGWVSPALRSSAKSSSTTVSQGLSAATFFSPRY